MYLGLGHGQGPQLILLHSVISQSFLLTFSYRVFVHNLSWMRWMDFTSDGCYPSLWIIQVSLTPLLLKYLCNSVILLCIQSILLSLERKFCLHIKYSKRYFHHLGVNVAALSCAGEGWPFINNNRRHKSHLNKFLNKNIWNYTLC